MTLAGGVAPTTGAWIETVFLLYIDLKPMVAPTTGAWIETMRKQVWRKPGNVAPTTGAWIETKTLALLVNYQPGRSHHGSVD